MIVVDASVALAWCLKDEGSAYADAVLGLVTEDRASAPAHWPLEVANGIRSAQRRGRIEDDEVSSAAKLLDQLRIEVVPIELTTAMWSILDTPRSLGLSTYDSAYLELARFRGVPLATLDERLRAASRSVGVQLVD